MNSVGIRGQQVSPFLKFFATSLTHYQSTINGILDFLTYLPRETVRKYTIKFQAFA